MPIHEFSSYVLRTTDPDAAAAFYDVVLGHHGDAVYPLHENALARGARPHWLGCVGTGQHEAYLEGLVAGGGERLGPRPGGGVALRDAGGALLALGLDAEPSVAGDVWHVLRTRDHKLAAETYARLFGWALGERVELGPGYRTFAWRPGAPSVGAVGALEDGVHPQWLLFFGVASIEAAVAAARYGGGTALPIHRLPDGRRCAVAEDPQGAAFGLVER